MPALPTGTVTFLFTDIEGSTKLWEEHPEQMRLALARHDTLMRAAIETNGGVVFKTIGDAFCAAFHTALNALNAALAAQLAFHSEAWPGAVTIKVRMALHTGTAEVRDNDYFGQPLNRVARLLAAGHGGQALLSLATQELTRDTLPPSVSLLDLGAHRLADLARPELVFQLSHPELPSEFPPIKSLNHLPNNLPQQVTSFIGREKEMAAAKTLLAKTRLLTMIGAGGGGKTRLALQIAADMQDNYPDGVWLVELASLSDPSLVSQSIAQVIGIKEQTGQTLQQTLIESLKSKRVLLLLDNCEHLLLSCAQVASALLRSCPNVKLLATSRELLSIGGELAYRVPSLSSPDLKQPATPQSLNQYEAVRLFIERAQFHKPDFTVTNQNAPALAQLCCHLDGIPLAIELAAARTRSLPLEDINSRLANRFRLLTGGDRTALPRQQTLRALIDWSYDLLNPQEKALFARLSVFAGGWTLEAAEQVCGGDCGTKVTVEAWEMLDVSSSLADKNLLIVEEDCGLARYRMLETIWQYAAEKAGDEINIGILQKRHHDYFFALAQERNADLSGSKLQEWLKRSETEGRNLALALSWCGELEAGSENRLEFASCLYDYWRIRGYYSEGRLHFQHVLEHDQSQQKTAKRARALHLLGNLAHLQGDYAEASEVYKQALTIYEQLDDKSKIANLLTELANLASEQNVFPLACDLYERALLIYRDLGDEPSLADAVNGYGNIVSEHGDKERARSLYEEALVLGRKGGSRQSLIAPLANLGKILAEQGEYARADALYEEALTICNELQDTRSNAALLFAQSLMLRHQGELEKAAAILRQCLEIFCNWRDKRNTAIALESLAAVLLAQGNAHKSVSLIASADVQRTECGSPLMLAERDEQLTQARLILDEAAFTTAWEEGRVMMLEQALAYALEEVDNA